MIVESVQVADDGTCCDFFQCAVRAHTKHSFAVGCIRDRSVAVGLEHILAYALECSCVPLVHGSINPTGHYLGIVFAPAKRLNLAIVAFEAACTRNTKSRIIRIGGGTTRPALTSPTITALNTTTHKQAQNSGGG